MEEIEVNRLLFLTIDKIKKIGSPKVSTWAIDDRYVRPPCFKFYFKDTVDTDIVYKKIHDLVTSYKGLLEWEMLHDESKSRSFFILPKPFASFVFKDEFRIGMDGLANKFSKEEYVQLVDNAIIDIPMLAKFIENNWSKYQI